MATDSLVRTQTMLFLRGANVYTAFRQQQLLQRLQQINPAIQELDAYYGYFVDAATEPTVQECEQLATILPQAQIATPPKAKSLFGVWVVPRLGTISPWSSKATDIVHNCELTSVTRVERGIFYQLHGAIDGDQTAVLAELHDPLTQSLLMPNDDLTAIFQHPTPTSYQTIDYPCS